MRIALGELADVSESHRRADRHDRIETGHAIGQLGEELREGLETFTRNLIDRPYKKERRRRENQHQANVGSSKKEIPANENHNECCGNDRHRVGGIVADDPPPASPVASPL